MSTTPIGEHALLSDCHSAALVDSAGSVEWSSAPRSDSPAVFARLLDDGAGHWSLRPAGASEVTRRYLPGSMVLADLLDARDRVPHWQRVREEVAEVVLREGWNDDVGACTQSFGSSELDAADLVLPIVGSLPADDPRVLATLDATQAG